MPVSIEDNMKLLCAHCIFNGDTDKVAAYMGITKNAVTKRYSKLVADEKANAEKLGFLTDGGTPKKRAAPTPSTPKSAKKVKKEVFDNDDDGESVDATVKTEEDGHGDAIKKE